MSVIRDAKNEEADALRRRRDQHAKSPELRWKQRVPVSEIVPAGPRSPQTANGIASGSVLRRGEELLGVRCIPAEGLPRAGPRDERCRGSHSASASNRFRPAADRACAPCARLEERLIGWGRKTGLASVRIGHDSPVPSMHDHGKRRPESSEFAHSNKDRTRQAISSLKRSQPALTSHYLPARGGLSARRASSTTVAGADETLDLKTRNEELVTLTGRLLALDRKPIANAQLFIEVESAAPTFVAVHTGPDGTFRTPKRFPRRLRYRLAARLLLDVVGSSDWMCPAASSGTSSLDLRPSIAAKASPRSRAKLTWVARSSLE